MDTTLLKSWLAWGMANPLIVLAVVVWIVANVMVRPHPDAMVGWKKIFWTAVDRVSILTADKLPGVLKLPLVASPPPAPPVPAPVVVEPPKDGETK